MAGNTCGLADFVTVLEVALDMSGEKAFVAAAKRAEVCLPAVNGFGGDLHGFVGLGFCSRQQWSGVDTDF